MSEPAERAYGLRILTVSQLNEQVKSCLEEHIGVVAVAGEIADLARPSSGHVYFTLRDGRAQVRAVCWRGSAERLPFALADGMKVIVMGEVTVYAPRGSYQVIASEIVPRGVGEIARALEALRRKLAAEGLFDPARKQPLPFLPLRLAVITSATGAAVHDIVRTALARFPALAIRVFPTRVQGAEAPKEIVAALAAADDPAVCDVILLGRGGGSIEDLWAFNAEEVVRAVAGCRLPIVSCVGHETDTTLSDLAADVRASTPTQAAELVVPVLAELLERLDGLHDRAGRAARGLREALAADLELLAARPALAEPARRLADLGQFVDDLGTRLEAGLCTAGQKDYNRLNICVSRLRSLDPLATLRRGFTVTRDDAGKILRSVRSASPGDRLEIRFADGVCEAEVRATREERLGTEEGLDALQGGPRPAGNGGRKPRARRT
jgi:exodeoxyribonuclease VII large subunit